MRAIAPCLALVTLSACAAAAPGDEFPADFPAAMREQLLDDAARRAGGERAALRVVSAQAVTWPDASIGCPLPGRVYTQALVAGWRVEVGAPGQAPLLYHASRRGGWLWCARERAGTPLPADARI